ncbi:hypothetical protein [Agromyces albus]|uniref:Uncharacterized protein n=1 Tax=Agromyces albus TaxID=205332 RepID=A0A4Q2KSP5_9MICO|nr:hypothetical protein [Agromyces albus]RXZ67490.1 hypothetical protein ESP51_17595 [Agromyces albus]
MNDNEQRDPLERLRAADPAAGLEARDGFADEVVARAVEETPAASPADAPPVTGLAVERARRRPTWLQVAAVAASLLVVGAAGYGVGSTTGGATNVADGAAPPVSLRSGAEGGIAEQGMTPEPPTDDAKMSAPDMGGMIYPYGGGRNHFSASGLSTSEGSAAAYGFDARAASAADTIAALATALGVEGTPELANGSWTAGPQDGSGPTLGVSLDGTLGFWFSDPRIDPWQCAAGTEKACEPSGEIPSEQAAIDALRSLLASTGRDPAGYEFTSQTWEGAVTRSAQAWPVRDGQRIDQAWTVELSNDGMFSASGALAELVPLGDYPVVSEQEAFDRLSDPRFGANMTTLPIAMRDAPVAPDMPAATDEWVPPTEPPAAPTPGAVVSWTVNDVEIVEARLGLASQWQPDGSVLVVPAYEFTDADGGTWSVIAVADAKLDFAGE